MKSQRLLIPNSIIFLLALLLLVLLVLSLGFGEGASAKTLVVSKDGQGDFLKIRDAINSADEGDEIRVWDGEYRESVNLYKQLNLVGNGSATTLVGGTNAYTGISIGADNCTVQGFSVKRGTYSGGTTAIRVGSTGNRIFDNRCFDSVYGIYFYSSKNNIVRNNRLEDCGIVVYGNSPDHWNTHVIETSNSVNGKPVHYLKDRSGLKAPDKAGQLILANCHNIIVEDQNFWDVSMGLAMGFCSNISISNISSGGGWEGVRVIHSNDVSFVDVNCSNNAREGLWLRDSSNVSVLESNFWNNKFGIACSGSNDISFVDVNCSNNADDGLRFSGSSNVLVLESNFWNNECGIDFNGKSSDCEIHDCSFQGNLVAGVDVDMGSYQTITVNATGNWWGSPLGPYHPEENPWVGGDNVTDQLLFSPWLRFLEPEETFADIMVLSLDGLLSDRDDLIPENGYLDVFFGDELGLEELVYFSQGEPSAENMSWSFGSGSQVIGEKRLNFTVGGDIVLVDRAGVFEGEVFVSGPPSQAQVHTLVFTVLAEDGVYTKECRFMVHPFARHTFSFKFTHLGEELTAEAQLSWRGLPEQAVTSFTHWKPGKVYVGLKPEGALALLSPPQKNSWMDLNYLLEIYGVEFQNGDVGFRALELKLPFSRASVSRLGVFDVLREDVSAYRYDKETRRYGPTENDSIDELEVADTGNHLHGVFPYSKQMFTSIALGHSGVDNYLVLKLGLAVKSIWTGEKILDLVLTSVELDHSHLLIGNTVNITATVESRGDVFVNGQLGVEFLGHNNETLETVMVFFGSGHPRIQEVSFSYFIDEPLGIGYGNASVTHRLKVIVDAEGLIPENDETNNYGEADLPVVEYRSSDRDSDPNQAVATLAMTTACSLGGLGLFWTIGLGYRLTKTREGLEGITATELFLSLPPQSSLVKRLHQKGQRKSPGP